MNIYNIQILILIILLVFILLLNINNSRNGNSINSSINNIKLEEGYTNTLLEKKNKIIYLFYSVDCMYSMEFIPIWETLKTLKDHSNTVEFRDIEESNDEDDNFIKYNIKQMPTIIIQNENEQDFTVYKGSRTLEDIVEFLKVKTGINLNKDNLEGFNNFNFDGENYKMETDEYIQNIHKDIKYTHPLFSLILSYIHLYKKDGKSIKDIIDLLNLKENKDFLKCNKNGICTEIEELKKIYNSNNEIMELIELINKEVCISDFALIEV